VVIGQIHHIVGGKFRMEFFFEQQGIGQPCAEGDDGPGIASVLF
jgi:hypothetical protein